MEEYYVYDPPECRQWGPFPSAEAASEFIEKDKYLASWAVVTTDMRKVLIATYKPEEY